jgi:hypothetical protein
MLKDILLKTAELINRDDLIEGLNSDNNSQSIQNDILRMISYYNYTMETLCENYFNLSTKQLISSDNKKQIYYFNFTYKPTKVLSVLKNNKNVFFSEYTKHITVPEANTEYEIIYKFIPDRLSALENKINLPYGITEKIICYGIASEFLASKNQFDKAKYWNDKFMFEIFKSKTRKDRKLKPTFTI